MGITLNIIAHELAEGELGRMRVVASSAARLSQTVEDARPYEGGPLRPAMLYVFDGAHRPHPSDLERFSFVQVGGEPLPHATLALPDEVSAPAVLETLRDILLRYLSWEQALDASVVEGGDIQKIIDLSTPFLKNNIVVVDPALKLLAWTRDVPCDDPVTVELINHGYHTDDNIKKFKLNKRFEPWASQDGFIINTSRRICRYDTVVHSFKTKRSFSLIVVMMCNKVDPAPWLLDSYAIALRRIGFYARRDYPDDKPSGNAVDLFLREVLLGNLEDEAALRERSRFAGIPFEHRFCLFCIEAGGRDLSPMRLVADVARKMAPAKTILMEGMVVVLCFNCCSCECRWTCRESDCASRATASSHRLGKLLDHFGLACGRSATFSTLAQARCALEQARAALSLAKRGMAACGSLQGGRSAGRIVCFEDCLVEHLLFSGGGKDAAALARQTPAFGILREIAAYDSEHHTDNLRFLFHYLHGERRASVVAEQMHMHRNNVKYRTDKLEETFGIDLANPSLRFSLMVAFRFLDDVPDLA